MAEDDTFLPAKKSLADKFKFLSKYKHLSAMLGIIVLIFAITLAIYQVGQKQDVHSHAAALQTSPLPAVSPLIFGTNLGLFNSGDQFISSAQTRSLLSQINVQLIRMPIRSSGANCPNSVELQAAQDIKAMGAVPLIILHLSTSTALSDDKQIVAAMNQIFGNNPVYYEFGNESDLNGVSSPSTYTTDWDNIISQVKPLAINGLFGGPVNFQYNPTYVSYFVHNAIPKPDFISWHEYTCGNSDTAQYCIQHIANWGKHITLTKQAIQNYGDQVPPIFITEWNYDPNNPQNDPRATAQFQQQFTQTALQELANDGVTGAAQYVATGHQYYNLVDPNNTLTPEGQEFGTMFNSLVNLSGYPTTTPFPTNGVNTNPITQMPPTATPTTMPYQNPSPSSPVTNVSMVCSSNTNPSCMYTSNCSGYASGTTCEAEVNGCGNTNSGNNVYICSNGQWVYNGWMKTSSCNFCAGGSNSSNPSQNSSSTPTPTPVAQSSSLVCSSSNSKSCGYTSSCSQYPNGTQCALEVNGCGAANSGSNIYTCQSGEWVYSKWIKTTTCNFCAN